MFCSLAPSAIVQFIVFICVLEEYDKEKNADQLLKSRINLIMDWHKHPVLPLIRRVRQGTEKNLLAKEETACACRIAAPAFMRYILETPPPPTSVRSQQAANYSRRSIHVWISPCARCHTHTDVYHLSSRRRHPSIIYTCA